MPGGYTWPFVISIDATMVVVSVVAAAQRPWSQWWIAGIALIVGFLPYLVFFSLDRTVSPAVESAALWVSWTAGTPSPGRPRPAPTRSS